MCMYLIRLCTCLDWDKDGDVLSITQEKNGEMHIQCTLYMAQMSVQLHIF